MHSTHQVHVCQLIAGCIAQQANGASCACYLVWQSVGTKSTRPQGRDMSTFPSGFLWGASTAPHQIEGNNVNSDWWAQEQVTPGMELSGDAVDSYHRWH